MEQEWSGGHPRWQEEVSSPSGWVGRHYRWVGRHSRPSGRAFRPISNLWGCLLTIPSPQ